MTLEEHDAEIAAQRRANKAILAAMYADIPVSAHDAKIAAELAQLRHDELFYDGPMPPRQMAAELMAAIKEDDELSQAAE